MKEKTPDKKKAKSLLEAAEKEMGFTKTLELSEVSSSTIFRNIYECFHLLGQALLVSKGIEATDHKEPIYALTSLTIKTERPTRLLDELRKTRNNINYRGYRPSLAEVNDAQDIARACFLPLSKEIKRLIE